MGRRVAIEGINVEAYAGARYPERPTALEWAGRRIEVQRVAREWQEPGERHFRVETPEGMLHLLYRETKDRWYVSQKGTE